MLLTKVSLSSRGGETVPGRHNDDVTITGACTAFGENLMEMPVFWRIQEAPSPETKSLLEK